jgi:alpha-beta hydrolase superfamily lysophospholipase
VAAPAPVEIASALGIVRGQHWPGDANWVILLHEPGADLDIWGSVPAAIATEGYSILAIDLPGHGLSDDPWRPGAAVELINTLAGFARANGASKVAVVAPGELATAAMFVRGLGALVALTPVPSRLPHPAHTPPVLILIGGAIDEATEAANACFRQTRSWAVLSSLGTAEQGSALFHGEWGDHALEQTLAFLRDYRVDPSVKDRQGKRDV